MRYSRILVLLGIMFSTFLFSGVSSRDLEKKPIRVPLLNQPVSQSGPRTASPATPPSSAVLLAEYDFDNAGSPDPQGWLSEDAGAIRDTFFHVADFAGLGPAYTPISGNQSLWCGTADSERFSDWISLPGYGNYWYQYFESVAFATLGDVTLQFDMRYDCEAGFDSVTVQFKDKNGQWQDWASYTGAGTEAFNALLPEDTLDGSASFRIRFESDGGYSDEEGLYDSDGAVIIDNITVSDQTGLLDTQSFEGEAVGDRSTADGDWRAYPLAGFGDYSGLFDGTTVLQEDSLITNSTHVWGFFNGSTDTYACGGHPEQLAVPLRLGNGPISQAIDNRIYSPWIDLNEDIGGTPLPFSPEYVVIDVDAYVENPLDNAVFFKYEMRFMVDGSSTDWVDDNFVTYWPGTPQWSPLRYTHPVSSGATHVQVALDVQELSLYGSGVCHSHAPLFDNVSVSVLENTTGLVTTINDSGPGSLRQAILDANASPDTSVIEFSLSGSAWIIRPQTPLPAITEPVIIDGYTQPGSSPNTSPPGVAGNAALRVTLDGDRMGPGVANHGLTLSTDYCTIRGLAINRFGGAAIYCPNSGAHVIEGNHIGVHADGTTDWGNAGPYAVYLLDGDSTTIGGTSPAARNVISGNDSAAIYISGDGNVVQGNLIGTDATGAVAMGNDEGGIYVPGTGNTIGGITAAARNVIAANGIGSTSHRHGVEITSPGADNIVQGNYIGTDITGTVGMGNLNGIGVVGSAGNIIGGTVAGAGNVISASQRVGIGISWSGSSGNLVQGNTIGTDASGVAPLGNNEEGIRVWGAPNNTIGGTEAGAGNIVAFTVSGSGISVHEAISSGNAILSNSIFSNGDIGLGLGPWDGVTMNDSADVDTGPNGFQNFPVLTAENASSIRIEGTLNSTPTTQFRLEFFSNTTCDPTGHGEGKTFIGSTSVTTDAMGDATFTAHFSEAVSYGSFVTATATDPNGSTSEFCECVEVVDCPPVIYVDSSATGADDGSSWADAFAELRDALAFASFCPSSTEIWVAAGTYMPTGGVDRTATFQLISNVALYGGFAGTETTLGDRDWVTNVTVLSGDIGVVDDDTDNSYHVVTASGTNSSTVLDGFSIVNGEATGVGEDGYGGGIYNSGGSPIVQNVWIYGHGSIAGGSAMYNNGANPIIQNTIVYDRILNVNGSVPVITNSSIVLSKLINDDSSPLIYNTILWTSGEVPVVENTGTSSPSFRNSLVMGSGGSTSWDPSFGTDLGNNIDDDPLFVDVTIGDVHLLPGSPAIDVGDNGAPNLPATDLGGNPRVVGAAVDMGAYESPQNTSTGVDVVVQPVDETSGTSPVTMTFDSVEVAGVTSLTMSGAGPSTPGGYNVGGTPTYYDIATTATYTDSIDLCIEYDESSLPDETSVRLLHYDTTLVTPDWVDVTISADTLLNVVCGRAATLSPFLVALYDGVTAVPDLPPVPSSFALHQNVPNPFNPTTVIHYDVPEEGGRVTLQVYDVAGRLVRTLVDGVQTPGEKRVTWNGRNSRGNRVATGVYFYRMTAAGFTKTRKMVLLQ